jgi:hypothetical protein
MQCSIDLAGKATVVNEFEISEVVVNAYRSPIGAGRG